MLELYNPKGGEPFVKPSDWKKQRKKLGNMHFVVHFFCLRRLFTDSTMVNHHCTTIWGNICLIFSNRLKQNPDFFCFEESTILPFYHLFLGPVFGQVGENISPKTRKLYPQDPSSMMVGRLDEFLFPF